MKSRALGLRLLSRALDMPATARLPNNPLDLLTTEYNDDECSAQPDSADSQPRSRSGSLRARPGK